MKPGLTAAVMKLLKGCSPIDVAWHTREDALCTNLYCLEQVSSDPEAGYEAYHPDSCEVPWPVLLLLGAHSRKHIFERTQNEPPEAWLSTRTVRPPLTFGLHLSERSGGQHLRETLAEEGGGRSVQNCCGRLSRSIQQGCTEDGNDTHSQS